MTLGRLGMWGCHHILLPTIFEEEKRKLICMNGHWFPLQFQKQGRILHIDF